MRARLLIPTVLRRYSGGVDEVAVAGATVGEAIQDLLRIHPDLKIRVLNDRGEVHPHLLLFRNNEQVDAATALDDGDVVEIVGAAEGG